MMKSILMIGLMFSLMFSFFGAPSASAAKSGIKTIYQFEAVTIEGKKVSLADYQGKALMIVNTASKCGFTPQYEGLQKLYEQYKFKGFEILGFPSDDFKHQEPGTNAEIKKFCELKYNVKFPLFAKNPVSGPLRQPLYSWLVQNDPKNPGQPVGWNFEKFIITRDGKVYERFLSKVSPDSPEVGAAVEAALK